MLKKAQVYEGFIASEGGLKHSYKNADVLFSLWGK